MTKEKLARPIPLVDQHPELAPKKRRVAPFGAEGTLVKLKAFRALEFDYRELAVEHALLVLKMASANAETATAIENTKAAREAYKRLHQSFEDKKVELEQLRLRLEESKERERDSEAKAFRLESDAYAAKAEHAKEIERAKFNEQSWKLAYDALRNRYKGISDAVQLLGRGTHPEDL